MPVIKLLLSIHIVSEYQSDVRKYLFHPRGKKAEASKQSLRLIVSDVLFPLTSHNLMQ